MLTKNLVEMKVTLRTTAVSSYLTRFFLLLQVGPPLPAADLLTFVKAAFSCRQAAGGRVFVHSRVGLDSCLLYATLETMLAQGPTDTAIPVS